MTSYWPQEKVELKVKIREISDHIPGMQNIVPPWRSASEGGQVQEDFISGMEERADQHHFVLHTSASDSVERKSILQQLSSLEITIDL